MLFDEVIVKFDKNRHPREGGDPEGLEKTGFPPPRESSMYGAFAPSYETNLGMRWVLVYLCEVGMVA